MTKDDWIHRISMIKFHAEIQAMNSHQSKVVSNQSSSISNQFPSDAIKVLSLYFDDYYNAHDNYDNDARYHRNNCKDNNKNNEFHDYEYNDHIHDHEDKKR